MRKVFSVLAGIIIPILVISLTILGLNSFYASRIEDKYNDKIGFEMLNEKNQGIELQRESLMRRDNLMIYGSSELGTADVPTHPNNLFKDKSGGFQINLVGRGYSQSIIHAINFGALAKELKGKKVVVIVSPQWFTPQGLGSEEFHTNFSELQFYTFMSSKQISKEQKLYLAQRVEKLVGKNAESIPVKTYAKLYSNNNFLSNAALKIMSPYYNIKTHALQLRDKRKTLEIISRYGENSKVAAETKRFDWDEELKKAEDLGKAESSNNPFGIRNSYYDKYIKEKFAELKGSYKGQSYVESPEYDDLKLLLELCKSNDIKPLFVSVPVHGEWYDYGNFSKEDRSIYYDKVNKLISSYGFEVADFSGHEYEDYFLVDIMHLGWKGWVHVDKAINEFYNSNK